MHRYFFSLVAHLIFFGTFLYSHEDTQNRFLAERVEKIAPLMNLTWGYTAATFSIAAAENAYCPESPRSVDAQLIALGLGLFSYCLSSAARINLLSGMSDPQKRDALLALNNNVDMRFLIMGTSLATATSVLLYDQGYEYSASHIPFLATAASLGALAMGLVSRKIVSHVLNENMLDEETD